MILHGMGNWSRWSLLVSLAVNAVVAVALWRGKLGRPETERAELTERRLHVTCNSVKWRLDRDLISFDQALARGEHAALRMGREATNSYTNLLLGVCTWAKASGKSVDEWDAKHLDIADRYTLAKEPAAARAALVEMRNLFAELGQLPNVAH